MGGAAEPEIAPEGEASAGRPTAKLVEPEEPTPDSSAGPNKPGRAPEDTAPLAPGTVIADRFEIVELVESSPEHNRYRARDLMRCATCGYEGNAPGDAYCADCGALLQAPAYASILEQVHVPPEAYDAHFAVGRRDYYISAEPAQGEVEPPIGGGAAPVHLAWGRATESGHKRDHNEDYMEGWLYTRASGGLVALFIVADGLGGQDSGEVASKMATDAVWGSLRDAVWQPIIQGEELRPDALEERVAEAVRAANRAIYEERIARGSEMSTTLTMALIVDTTAYIANVGDSRTYLWNADGLQRITCDHSLVQRLVDAGQIGPEEVYTHPQRNLIYQSIGDRPEAQVDTFRRHLAADDRLILCSDGLWEMVHDDGLEEVLLSEPDPQRACDRLAQNANLAGGEDNITVIIVQAQRA
jgi:serine/threonine protein phosphatase PrpC